LENQQWHQVTGRQAEQDQINQMVANEMKKRPAEVWLERMIAERLPVAPINDFSDAANDPQVVYRGVIHTLDHPVSGPIRVVGPGWKMTGPEPEMRPPPLLNQHMDDVLQSWLGWDEGQITAFKKAIGKHD
jgi:formyl-CoA transferase